MAYCFMLMFKEHINDDLNLSSGEMYLRVMRKDMDVNEHESLSNFTLRHKLKSRNTIVLFYSL